MLNRPLRRGPVGASSSNCCCCSLFFRGAGRCLSLSREELGALKRRAGLPRSPLRGTLHVASDIPGPVEQPDGLRGQLDSNDYGSAEPGNLFPQLPQRFPCPPRSPPAASDGSGLRASGPGKIWLSGSQVDEGGVIGISGVQTDLLVG